MKRLLVVAALASCLTSTAFGQQIPTPTTGVPRFDNAVRKAVGFLHEELRGRKTAVKFTLPEAALAAYACLKAGMDHHDPVIESVVADIKAKKFPNGPKEYVATGGAKLSGEYVYHVGVFAMLLEAQDAKKNAQELKSIAKFLIQEQGSDGSWDYPQRTTGDTSMNQYGVLGLWACMRAGANVPPQVWDKCIGWHIDKQNADAGWAYHPGTTAGPGEGASTHNMTYGATGTTAICRLILDPKYAPGAKKKKKKKLFGVLEEVETITEQQQTKINPYATYTPRNSLDRASAAIKGGLGWLNRNFELANPFYGNPMYFYYAMERSLALNEVEKQGGQDWYYVCGNRLVETQDADGSWLAAKSGTVDTSFVVLFFVKSTAALIGKVYGRGVQIGKRGLDLDNPNPMADGKNKKKLGPLDEMLARLDQMNLQGITGVPEEDLTDLVNKILETPRKELSSQIPLLKKLKDYPRGDVRAVVMFGLGRSGDMRVAPILIDALNDNDVGVLSEAHTALCYISRKPRGFGINTDLAGEVEGLPQTEVDKIVNKWRKQAQTRWKAWYKRIRPYDERGDLWEISSPDSAKK